MSDDFDPYYRWLGISTDDRPPDHYRLLGLELFESDPDVIDAIALRHIGYLQEIADGPHVRDAQRLLNELTMARRCLLDPHKKADYDRELKARLAVATKQVRNPKRAIPPKAAKPRVSRHAPPVRPPSSMPPPASERSTPQATIRPVATPLAASPAASTRPKRSLVVPWLVAATIAIPVLLITAIMLWRSDDSPIHPAVVAGANVDDAPNVAAHDHSDSTGGIPSDVLADAVITDTGPTAPFEAANPRTNEDSVVPLDTELLALNSEVSPRPATPITTTGLVLWLDAASLPSVASPLSRWPDRRNTDLAAVQDGLQQQPSTVPNGPAGFPCVRFQGRQWLEVPRTSRCFAGEPNLTVAFVVRGHQGVVLSKGSGDGDGDLLFAVDPALRGESTTTADETESASYRFKVYIVTGTSETLTWYCDGQHHRQHVTLPAVQSRNVFWVGSAFASGGQASEHQLLVGDLAELLVYERELIESERQTLEDYLAEKWLDGSSKKAPFLVDAMSAPIAGDSAATVLDEPTTQEDDATTLPDPIAADDPTAQSHQPADSPLDKPGQLRREVWIDFLGGTLDLAQRRIADQGTADESTVVEEFAAPEDYAEHYCQRLSGYLQPPLSGEYRFAIKANQEAVLFLSNDDRPENKRRIDETDRVELQAGRAYFVEGLHRETTGKDHFSVGWTLPDGTRQDPIPGGYLALHSHAIPPHETGFVTLRPNEVSGASATTFQFDDDGWILAGGDASPDQTYRIVCPIQIPRVTAVLLEAAPHASLPGGGPGRAAGGMFRLAELTIQGRGRTADSPAMSASWRAAVVEPRLDTDGVERIVDADPTTVWTVRRRNDRTTVLLLPSQPIDTTDLASLEFQLLNRECLGHFRFSVTSADDPHQLDLPAAMETEPADHESRDDDTFVLSVNVGGGPIQVPGGVNWLGDQPFGNNDYGHEGGQSVTSKEVLDPVAGCAQRGLTAFRAVVPNGRYRVELIFSEHWTANLSSRVFFVYVEGRMLLGPADIVPALGMGRPVSRILNNLNVTDERLDIDFRAGPDGALSILNAVRIDQLR